MGQLILNNDIIMSNGTIKNILLLDDCIFTRMEISSIFTEIGLAKLVLCIKSIFNHNLA